MASKTQLPENTDRPQQDQREKFTDEKTAAEHIGLSKETLQGFRLYEHRRRGFPIPPHYRIGRSIRYKLSELEAWATQLQIGGAQ